MHDESPAPDRPPVALAGTEVPVVIRVVPIADDRAPTGTICLGTFIDERLVARCVVPPELHERLEAHSVFGAPVRLVLSARQAPPGLQCQLFALTPLPPGVLRDSDDEDEAEPWSASVPSSNYEREVEAMEHAEAGQPVAVIPLGQIVRFEQDLQHPEDLAIEAADVLGRIVQGNVVEVVDKVLEDLLGTDDDADEDEPEDPGLA